MSLVNSQDSKNLFQTNDLLNFEDNEEFDETLLLDSANLETANFNNKSNQDSLFNTEKNLLDFEHNTFDDQKFQTAGGKNLFEVSDKSNILNTQEENEQFQKQIEEFSNLPSMMSFSSNTYNKVKPNNNSLIQNLIQPKDIIKEVESDKEFTPNKIIEDIFLKKENSNLKVIKQAKNNDIVPTFKDSICDSKVETSNQNFDVYSFKANLTKK